MIKKKYNRFNELLTAGYSHSRALVLLYSAFANEDLEVVRILLSKGMNLSSVPKDIVELPSDDHFTPWVIKSAHNLSIIDALVDSGAKIGDRGFIGISKI